MQISIIDYKISVHELTQLPTVRPALLGMADPGLPEDFPVWGLRSLETGWPEGGCELANWKLTPTC